MPPFTANPNGTINVPPNDPTLGQTMMGPHLVQDEPPRTPDEFEARKGELTQALATNPALRAGFLQFAISMLRSRAPGESPISVIGTAAGDAGGAIRRVQKQEREERDLDSRIADREENREIRRQRLELARQTAADTKEFRNRSLTLQEKRFEFYKKTTTARLARGAALAKSRLPKALDTRLWNLAREAIKQRTDASEMTPEDFANAVESLYRKLVASRLPTQKMSDAHVNTLIDRGDFKSLRAATKPRAATGTPLYALSPEQQKRVEAAERKALADAKKEASKATIVTDRKNVTGGPFHSSTMRSIIARDTEAQAQVNALSKSIQDGATGYTEKQQMLMLSSILDGKGGRLRNDGKLWETIASRPELQRLAVHVLSRVKLNNGKEVGQIRAAAYVSAAIEQARGLVSQERSRQAGAAGRRLANRTGRVASGLVGTKPSGLERSILEWLLGRDDGRNKRTSKGKSFRRPLVIDDEEEKRAP